MSAYGLNLPQDPLNSNVEEEVIEREEEEVIKEYYSDSDPQLSGWGDVEWFFGVCNVENTKWKTNKSSG